MLKGYVLFFLYIRLTNTTAKWLRRSLKSVIFTGNVTKKSSSLENKLYPRKTFDVWVKIKTCCDYCDITLYLDNPRFDIGGNAGRDQCSRDKSLQNSFSNPQAYNIYIYKKSACIIIESNKKC